MKKEQPLKLDREILNQLAPSQLVEIIIEQTKAIEQLGVAGLRYDLAIERFSSHSIVMIN